MAGLYVYRSNRLEALGARLADVLRDRLPGPLQEELIVVQSLGMRRWISFELARRLGVTMNCRFPFFQEFGHDLLQPGKAEDAFSRAALPWRILALLPRLLETEAFQPLERYAGTDSQAARRRFQLARQVATVFDRYLAYSPERLLRWEDRQETGWQAQLWRALSREHSQTHPPALLQRFLARAQVGEPLPEEIPPRITVFGISGVPPFFLHLLSGAGKLIDVHLFLLEPTDHYWADIRSSKEQARLLRKPEFQGHTAEDLHFDPANELLASLGKPGRAFSGAIADLEPHGSEEIFTAPERTTLLSAIQSDIYHVTEPATAEEPEASSIPPGDASVQVHCCHGPLRELQVLHDRLLATFEALPGLLPKDILVTMPEVEAYAPFIEAVFASPESETRRLPFSIADRSAQAESAVAGALLKLLGLSGSRFTATEVLALLEIAPVRERFSISESEFDDIRRWVDQTGIRWGIDGAHRSEFGLPDFAQNSWRAGLDRLLLGFALPGDGATLYGEVLPWPEVEGSQAALLGRFTDFCEKLFRLVPALSAPRPLGDWENALRELLDTFVDDHNAVAHELKRVRGALRGVGALREFHPEPVPFEVLRTHLTAVLSESETGYGFLAGHITFCSLKPMRSVPFRVICILGLNDTAFPRREPSLGFDLLAQEGGGRSRRDDDRQLFLETILSARDALYLSYSGLSPRDNTESPPSVVVTELLDYVARNYAPALTVTKHPLQPYSTRYFEVDGPLFSYSTAALAASRASCRPVTEERLPVLLGEPESTTREVELDDLARFFKNPAKFFLQRRLRMRLLRREESLEDCEPLKVDGLSKWQLQAQLASREAGGDTLALVRADGILPVGWFGAAAHEKISAAVGCLLTAVGELRAGGPLPPQPTRLAIGEWHLESALPELFASGMVHIVAWALKGSDRLRTWIHHLFLNAAAKHKARTTRLFGTDYKVEFEPVENAAALLADLLELYAQGLREPLPYFPESSYLFAKGQREEKKNDGARRKWEERERKDEYNDLCFRGRDPLDERWQTLSERVLGPMLAHARETELA